MSSKLYDLLQERGPDALVGEVAELNGVPHEIISLAAVGEEMIVYNLRNLETKEEDKVLKIPRARPGTPEHMKLMQSYKLAMERIPDLIAPTQFANVGVGRALSRGRPQPEATIQRLVMDALRALAQRNFAQAHASVDEALRIGPDNIEALHNKGVILAAEDRYDEAMAMFDRVLDLKPGDLDALTNRGHVLFEKKDLKNAFETFKEVIDADDGYVHGWIGIGKVLGTARKFSEAELCFRRALEIDPENEQVKSFLAQTQAFIKKDRT